MAEHQTPAQEPHLIDATEAFTKEELSVLTELWGDTKPPGKFLRGRHGITHYVVDRDEDQPVVKSKKGMVVLSHGMSQSLKTYQDLSDILVKRGFSVLRYDYFGHGYGRQSRDKDLWIKYTPDKFVDQLEDLLDHVYKEEGGEEVVGFIGHSNGAVNGISANYRWASANNNGGKEGGRRGLIPKMILVNPALFAKKPLVARVADRVPKVMRGLMKTVPSTKSIVGNSIMKHSLIAFAKDPETKEYLYPEAQKKNMDTNLRLFGRVEGVSEHPFLAPAIFGASSYNLAGDLLPVHRENLSELLRMSRGGKSDTLYVWCDLDVSVPFKENVGTIRKMAEENENLTLEVVQNLGHHCFAEDTTAIANAVLPFLESS